MSGILKEILTTFGPLALGWVGFLGALWYVARMHREHREDYKELIHAQHEAIENNTKVMTVISTRLEERSRAGGD